MKRIVPLLVHEDLGEARAFWVDRYGFDVTVELPADPSADPAGQPLGFVMLDKGGATLMLQSRASVELDTPGVLGDSIGKEGAALFVEVEDLDEVIGKSKGLEVTTPDRETFYGMREFGVRGPDGVLVTFAQKIEGAG